MGTKPFSLEEVVRQLETVVLNDKYVNTEAPSFEKCVELSMTNLSENFKNWYNQFEKPREEKASWGDYIFWTNSIATQASNKKYDFEEKYTAVQLEDVVKEWVKPAEAPLLQKSTAEDFDDLF